MLNTRDLEKRWLHYKIKSYIPHAVIFVSIIIIILILLILTIPSKIKEEQKTKAITITKPIAKIKVEQNSTAITKKKEPINTPLNKLPQTPVLNSQKDTTLTLTPSMGFVKHMQNQEQQPYYTTIHTERKKVKKEQKRRRKMARKQPVAEEEYLEVKEKKNLQSIAKEQPKKQIITIEKQDSKHDIQEIVKRFKKDNNPALSLFLAKKYYELGNYEQSYNYALITNGINNGIEASWLIFVKSLVKLHKKEMAIKTLREYINYSHSENAKILLNDIESGKFK
ncbi:Transformation system protein [hydrothermal vent metagenome]|uniref:Transformation system protein n=1 Tax=hydrothermal vent metagenome TaxID=652676 RepID=A0A1W1CPP8_9ZZZZ